MQISWPKIETSQVARLLPFIPFNASFMTSNRALKLMGPFLGPVASVAGWLLGFEANLQAKEESRKHKDMRSG